MSPGAFWYHSRSDDSHDESIVLAVVIAILFLAVAATSFAVDQSLTLSNLPAP